MKNSSFIAMIFLLAFTIKCIAEIPVRTFVGDETGYNNESSVDAKRLYNSGCIELWNNHNYASAADYFNKALSLNKEYVNAWDNLGICYRKMQKYGEAEQCYKNSLRLKPDGYMAHVNLAIIYKQQGLLNKALDEYQIVKRNNPSSPESYYGISTVYAQIGKYDLAIEEALQAVDRYKKTNDPNVVDAYSLLSKLYEVQGNSLKSQEYLILSTSR
jgi:tetratricopeptide (TPR) repeat protein